MFKWTLFALVIFSCYQAGAQKLQTIVPEQPVVIGTAFQVQYIITHPSELNVTSAPSFDSFRLVSGPNHYKGNALIDGKLQPIENITYTLVPVSVGKLTIKGITARFNGLPEQSSQDVVITVIPKPKQSFTSRSSYTDVNLYAPSSKADLDRLVRENIFVRAVVNKRNCFVGEPITASFKLYSRLQSSSELLRVPALYGFGVIDILDINEAHQAVETIKGKVFNTSVLREVQLYPEQAGELLIDEMVVNNIIEFDDSLNRGLKITIQKELRTEAIKISVKPLPVRKPENFDGAVGQFTITSALLKDVAVNEQGKLMITVSGRGNFIQLGEPSISWPKGLDIFEPVISDELNTSVVPATGKRTYEYGFTSDSAGVFVIPSIELSFFDPLSASYRSSSTAEIRISIKNRIKEKVQRDDKNIVASRPILWMLPVAALAIVVILLLLRKRGRKSIQEIKPVEEVKPTISQNIEDIDLRLLTDKDACRAIQKELSAIRLLVLSEEQQTEFASIMSDCQLLGYADINEDGKKEELKLRAVALAKSLE